MTFILFGTVLPWLLVAVGMWLGYQLVRQNGRILWRLESIETQLGPRAGAQAPRREPGGLPVGTLAPDFELPDLTGARRKLSDFRGKNVLLMFFNPNCGFCTRMAADLAALPSANLAMEAEGEWTVPIVVTTGDAEENRKLVEQYGIRCVVLLQEQMEVASQFRAQGTPMGYRIDAAGRIASELAVGAEPLLELATEAQSPDGLRVERRELRARKKMSPESGRVERRETRDESQKENGPSSKIRNPKSEIRNPAGANGHAAHGKHADPSLAKSRLNRSGLKAGATAPDFRLPRIDGGDLSLSAFRGGRVLLVFSDPHCGPCDALAPRLEQLHIERPDLQVLVVSRGDAEANRAKAAKLGLSYPIVLQKQWEISLKYAMFATPIGYLIDERGILASDVAVGVEPILALADEPAPQPCCEDDGEDAEPLLAGKEPHLGELKLIRGRRCQRRLGGRDRMTTHSDADAGSVGHELETPVTRDRPSPADFPES